MESTVFNTDCMEFMQSYNGEPPKLIVTDPPYDLPSWSGGGFMDESKRDWIAQMNVDNLSRSYDIETFATLVDKMQKGNINIYFFCNKLQIPQYFDEYVNKRKCKFDILSWHKTNAMPTFKGKYLTDTEYILYFRNHGGCDPQSYEDAKTFFLQDINIKDKSKWVHPTIKPLNIVRTLIRNSSKENDLMFDPFLGSGTSRVASFLENRRFLGCELDKSFYDLQQRRYDKECLNTVKTDNGLTITQNTLF